VTGERRKLLDGSGTAVYANGYLLFNRNGALMAQRFEVEELALQGEPTQIAEGLRTNPTGVYAAFSVSQTGVLAYVIGSPGDQLSDPAMSQLTWYDRGGRRLETIGEPGVYRGIALSSDARIAVHRHDAPDRGDILLGDERGTFMRFTDGPRHEGNPVFSPDGARVIYTGADYDLYEKSSTGVGREKLVFDALRFTLPTDWPRDDTVLVTHTEMTAGDAEISAVHLDADLPPEKLQGTAHNEIGGTESPDGRWLAYSSDESGRSEIYLVPSPQRDRKWPVSTTGGAGPQWSADGELFWYTPEGAIMAVTIGSADSGSPVGAPRELFRANLMIGDHMTSIGDVPHVPFAVTGDGERFLINERLDGSAGLTFVPKTTTIVVVRNWPALLYR
jgi:Tol biopolymer transport system component